MRNSLLINLICAMYKSTRVQCDGNHLKTNLEMHQQVSLLEHLVSILPKIRPTGKAMLGMTPKDRKQSPWIQEQMKSHYRSD